MQRLSGLDATFLSIETSSLLMHVSMIAVFDPSDMPGGYAFETVRDLIESRLPLIPVFRRRLVEVPFKLHFPVWVEDPDFDLAYHVRRTAVPSPGSMEQLCDMVGDLVSRPLDRSKPLWEIHVVEGLEGGRVGLIGKVHHAAIDGVSGAELLVHLFDLAPTGPPPQPTEAGERPVEHIPSDLELVAYAARSVALTPVRLARVLPSTLRSVLGLARRRREGATGMAVPFTAPRTPFNAALTSRRTVAVAHLSLDDVKRVKNVFGTTVNDVILALCAGALRTYLDGLGELPETPLVSVVPMSVRGDDEQGDRVGSNQVSGMFVSLATDVDDPVARLQVIADGTKGAKEDHRAIGATLLQDWAQFAAPAVFARASRSYSAMRLADRHPPIYNVIISNVPGPPFDLYLAGARITMLCPLGPVMEGAGLNITVLSYRDGIDVGLIACRDLVPDLGDLSAAFADSMVELTSAATAGR